MNCPRGVVVAHPPGKWKAQVRFLAVEQQFSYDWALCFLALLMRPDRSKWATISLPIEIIGWVLCMCYKAHRFSYKDVWNTTNTLTVNCPCVPSGHGSRLDICGVRVRFPTGEQQFSVIEFSAFLALLMIPDRLKWGTISLPIEIIGWVLCISY